MVSCSLDGLSKLSSLINNYKPEPYILFLFSLFIVFLNLKMVQYSLPVTRKDAFHLLGFRSHPKRGHPPKNTQTVTAAAKQITLRYIRRSFLFWRDVCGSWCGSRRSVQNEWPASKFFLCTPLGQYRVIFIVINLSKSVRVFLLLLVFLIFFLFFFSSGFTSCFMSCTGITPALTSSHLAFRRFPCLWNI